MAEMQRLRRTDPAGADDRPLRAGRTAGAVVHRLRRQQDEAGQALRGEGDRMRIALHDADREHLKRKTFPNYALMKIAAYHKARGDTVEWWNPLLNDTYGMIYSSKVFDFTPENPYLPQWAIKGGTGYNVQSKLPPEIDETPPDYSIYPACDHALGFITRGCPNKCRWCVVPEKEGGIQPYRKWREIAREWRDIVLMDNNILASDFGIAQLEELAFRPIRIDVNQGLDARLVDERIASILSWMKWRKFIRFSCDTVPQIESIENAAALLKSCGIPPSKLFIYLLVTKDIDDAAHRVERLKRLGAVTIYAQAERNERLGIVPNRAQMDFAQRYIYGGLFRRETWAEYQARHTKIAG
jgi:hypothetical protein